MLKKLLISSIMIGALAVIALADQAAYITKAEAQKAAKFLSGMSSITHFCAPCDDPVERVEKIDKVEAVAAGYEDYWEVKVNGKGIDLAYVYFETKDKKWKNLAREMGIEVEDVPTFLGDDAETDEPQDGDGY